jgi:hypothetical protein
LKERGQGRLRLALPWLECTPDADAPEGQVLPRTPAGEWLVARGESSRAGVGAWREWLLGDLVAGGELLRHCPAGPCLRALHTAAPPEGTWGCARPVHLVAAIDHLQLAPGRLVMDAAESVHVIGDINRHLEGSGFQLHDPGAGEDWLLECAQPLECISVDPDDASGRNLRDLMPGGRDGARMRSLMNEIQMLLHEHPVNRARGARRLPAFNSLWLWGIGSLGRVNPTSLPPLHTDDAWLAGLWRLHGAAVQTLDEFPTASPAHVDVLVASGRAPQGDPLAALTVVETNCFAPAKVRLLHGQAATIALLLGDRTLAVDGRARYRFWRRRRPLSEILG